MPPHDPPPRGDFSSETAPLRERVVALGRELANDRPRGSVDREETERFRLFLDNFEDYALITLDPVGCIVGWSRGAECLLGYAESEILGQSADVIFAPEDRAQGVPEQELDTAHTEGRAENERWHQRRDGSRFWGSGVLRSLCEPDGTIRGYVKILCDLTARQQYEEQLRESEERFRLFVENVTDYALFQVDPEGRISGWNAGAERTFGYPETEILGRSLAVLLPPEETGLVEEDLRTALTQGRAEYERWLVCRDGRRFWARWVTTPMRDGQGELRGFAKVLRDETERQRTEEDRKRVGQWERERLQHEVQATGQALGRTQKELRALAASLMTAQEEERRRIARDLHDDLGQRIAVLGFQMDQLQQQLSLEATPWESRLGAVRQQVTALAEEVRHFSHRLHPSLLEDLGLKPALRQLVEEFERAHGPIQFRNSGPFDPVPLPVATALYRITQEALRNALRHAPGELVTVELSQAGRELRLTIEDAGPGFDPEAAHARGGLGLISMQERAHLAGGTFHLTSAPGAGTRIEVCVPLPGEAE